MEKLDAKVEFKDGGFYVANMFAPSYLRSCHFQDEFEANLAYAIWLQFSKIIKEFPSINEYLWILKIITDLIKHI